MSGNLGANLINQLQNTPMASPDYWTHQMANMNALQDYNAKQATADAYRQSVDANGNFDQAGFNARVASGAGAWNAGPTMQAASTLQDTQTRQQLLRVGWYNGAAGALPDDASRDQVIKTIQSGAAVGMSPTEIQAEIGRVPTDPAQLQSYIQQHRLTAASAADQLQRQYGTRPEVHAGGTVQFPNVPAPGKPAGPGQTTGVQITASPDAVVGMPDAVVPATADDVKNGLASAPGQPVHISGAERIRRFGYTGLLPPGAIEIPNTGGGTGGGGGGVVNSDGTRVGPNNPPKLNVPAPATSTPPAATPPAVTAPPVAPASPAASPLPVPPVPPAGGPPAAPTTAAASPTPPPPAPASATDPPAVASAKAAAKTTGKPVPIVGGNGLVANPDGSVGPAGGSGFPRPSVNAPRDSMTPGPTSMLQGGVPVASANALAPNLGAPSAPSSLVPGDVNAIMAGINARRGAPATPGTQQAAGGTFAAGPGYDEQVNATTSQERLAADTKIAANYASNVFPYTQALSALGRGMTTAPGSDFLNAAKGFAGGMARSMGFGGTFDSTKDYDELHKWLSQIVTNNPVAQGSDARLAATLSGNANTGIHELASADMMKAGTALMRMNATASSEWANNPQVRAQYGYYNDFLRDFNKNVDPRAFAWDMYNPEQKKTLLADIDSHDEAYAQKFLNSRNMAQRNGYLGETQGDALMADDFLTTYAPLANDISDRTGLNPATVLGIIDTETGHGQHVSGNNIFGISPSGPQGQYVAGYPDVQTASNAFINLMKTPRYAGVATTTDPASQSAALVKGGYNTANPNYASIVARSAQNAVKQLGYQDQGAGNGPQSQSPAPTSAKDQLKQELTGGGDQQPPAAATPSPPATQLPSPTPAKDQLKHELNQPTKQGDFTGPPTTPSVATTLTAPGNTDLSQGSFGPDGSYVPPQAVPNASTPNAPYSSILPVFPGGSTGGGLGDPGTLTGAFLEGARGALDASGWAPGGVQLGRYIVNPLLELGGGLVRGGQQVLENTAEPVGAAVPQIRIPQTTIPGFGTFSGTVVGGPGLGRDVAAFPEAFPTGDYGAPEAPPTAQAARNALNQRVTVADLTGAIRRSDAAAGAEAPNALQPDRAPPPAAPSPAPQAGPVAPAPNLPPVPDGYVRLYHGGSDPTSGGARWVTPDYAYARDYRPGQPVSYVDVPKDNPAVQAAVASHPDEPMRVASFNAPEDIATHLRPVDQPTTPPQPQPTAAGAQVTTEPIPGQTPIQRATNIQKDVEQTAADRAGPGLRDDNTYVADIPPRIEAHRDFSTQTALDHETSLRDDPAYKAKNDAIDAERNSGMTDLLRSDMGDANTLKAARDERAESSPDKMGVFANEKPVDPGKMQGFADDVVSLMNGPEGKTKSSYNILKDVYDSLHDKDGNLETMPSAVYGARKNITNWLDKGKSGTEAGDAVRALKFHLQQMLDPIDDVINSGASKFGDWKQEWQRLSQPVNQQDFLQQYRPGTSKSLWDGDGKLQFRPVQKLLSDIQTAHTKPVHDAQSLTDQQIQNIVNVRNELATKKFQRSQALEPGSPTTQTLSNLAKKGSSPLGVAARVGAGFAAHAAGIVAAEHGIPLINPVIGMYQATQPVRQAIRASRREAAVQAEIATMKNRLLSQPRPGPPNALQP